MSEIKVTYIDHCGSDISTVNAARVSFGKKTNTLKQKDIELIKYLADNQHLSPFEHLTCTVKIDCPLYIRSQIHRHRTFSYNEISRRYTSENITFYVPPTSDVRSQSTDNKQCSGSILDDEEAFKALEMIDSHNTESLNTYNKLLKMGVAREQARSVLPMCTMTSFYMTGNLRNYAHFLKLRLHSHAQKEARMVAEQLLEILKQQFPVSMEALMSCKT